MTSTNDPAARQTQAADFLFSHFGAQAWGRQPSGTLAEIGGGNLPPDADAPPPIQNQQDLVAANEWLQRERKRLQEYTETQLERIAAEHQALVKRNYQNEQSMILACQELSRKEEMLTRQSRALQDQAAELSRRQHTLSSQLQEWSRSHGELADLTQARARTEQEAAEQRALVDSLRTESLALQKSRELLQAELETMARELSEQREQRERERALTQTQQSQMEERLRALDRAEQAAQRRVADLDELEAQLRDEFEDQERRLAEQRREVASLSARLRQRLQEVTQPPETK
jgi:hypothetical protein